MAHFLLVFVILVDELKKRFMLQAKTTDSFNMGHGTKVNNRNDTICICQNYLLSALFSWKATELTYVFSGITTGITGSHRRW